MGAAMPRCAGCVADPLFAVCVGGVIDCPNSFLEKVQVSRQLNVSRCHAGIAWHGSISRALPLWRHLDYTAAPRGSWYNPRRSRNITRSLETIIGSGSKSVAMMHGSTYRRHTPYRTFM